MLKSLALVKCCGCYYKNLNYLSGSYIGVNQTQGGYYKRMHDYYNTYKPNGSNRSQLAIQARWGAIQRSLNKFCGFKGAVDRRNESGKNEQDRVCSCTLMSLWKVNLCCPHFV